MSVTPPNGFDMEECRKNLIADEGIRAKVYNDSRGIPTIGIGRNVGTKGLSIEEIEFLFQNDVEEAMRELDRTDPVWRELPPVLQECMVNLMFNMGATTWETFINTRAALARFDFEGVAKGLRNSKWYTQVQRSRKERIVNAFLDAAKVACLCLFFAGCTTATIKASDGSTIEFTRSFTDAYIEFDENGKFVYSSSPSDVAAQNLNGLLLDAIKAGKLAVVP